jgi:hypothetical protein
MVGRAGYRQWMVYVWLQRAGRLHRARPHSEDTHTRMDPAAARAGAARAGCLTRPVRGYLSSALLLPFLAAVVFAFSLVSAQHLPREGPSSLQGLATAAFQHLRAAATPRRGLPHARSSSAVRRNSSMSDANSTLQPQLHNTSAVGGNSLAGGAHSAQPCEPLRAVLSAGAQLRMVPAAPISRGPASLTPVEHWISPAEAFSPAVPADAAARAAAACVPYVPNSNGPTLPRVLGGHAAAAAELGEAAAAGLLRPPAASAARHNTATACTELHPNSVYARGFISAGVSRWGLAEPITFISDRTALAAHGAALTAAVGAFVRDMGLEGVVANWSGTVGYDGPWVEDAWIGTFRRFTHHRASTEALLARARALVGGPFEGTLEAATHTLFECANVSVTGAFGAFLNAARQPTARCIMCTVDLHAVALLHEGGGGGAYTCAGAPSAVPPAPPAERRAFFQLFLSVPYDAELFHPYVPLFVPCAWGAHAKRARGASPPLTPFNPPRPPLLTRRRPLLPLPPSPSSPSPPKPPPPGENLNFAVTARNVAEKARLNGELPPSDFTGALLANPGLESTPADLVFRLGELLARTMRPDVHYVTVAQRPAGPWLGLQFIEPLSSTIVISSGGNGHIPIPLLARELPRLPVRGSGEPPPPPPFVGAAVAPFGSAQPALSFFGKRREGPRTDALDAVARAAPSLFKEALLPNNPAAWVPAFANTTLAFAPRGVGATSFRLYEALQLGVPPVFVYDQAPWLPYWHPSRAVGKGASEDPSTSYAASAANPPPPPRLDDGACAAHPATRGCFSWEKVAHVVELVSIDSWANSALPAAVGEGGLEAWEAMRGWAGKFRDSHFTYEGVMRHVFRWLEDPGGAELYCTVASRPAVTFF